MFCYKISFNFLETKLIENILVLNTVYLTRPWQTYQFSFFKPYMSITPLNYWQSRQFNKMMGIIIHGEVWNTIKVADIEMSKKKFSLKKAKFTTFFTFSGNSGNSEIAMLQYQNKNSSSYSIKIKSVWL